MSGRNGRPVLPGFQYRIILDRLVISTVKILQCLLILHTKHIYWVRSSVYHVPSLVIVTVLQLIKWIEIHVDYAFLCIYVLLLYLKNSNMMLSLHSMFILIIIMIIIKSHFKFFFTLSNYLSLSRPLLDKELSFKLLMIINLKYENKTIITVMSDLYIYACVFVQIFCFYKIRVYMRYSAAILAMLTLPFIFIDFLHTHIYRQTYAHSYT
ncbi:unnamed protein product [Schistosoma haematobium]|nr:unnamed protein product [Schistosoma haematobium]